MKDYTVYFMRLGHPAIFVCLCTTKADADRIASNLASEFGVQAWAEED